MVENRELAALREEIRALREDVETQTAINVVEGINTIETLAVLGHFMARRQPPTPREAADLERLARERWSQQVRQAVAIVKRDVAPLESTIKALGELLPTTTPPAAAPKRSPARRPKTKPAARGKRR
jgi:hypothetical protein